MTVKATKHEQKIEHILQKKIKRLSVINWEECYLIWIRLNQLSNRNENKWYFIENSPELLLCSSNWLRRKLCANWRGDVLGRILQNKSIWFCDSSRTTSRSARRRCSQGREDFERCRRRWKAWKVRKVKYYFEMKFYGKQIRRR